MAQEIVFYHSEMQGAPSKVLNAAGALLAVLDACLVDGFNVNSISTLTQSGGVATATTSGTNGYSIGDWVEVADAVPAAYNGRVKVTGKPGTDKFTYAVPPGTASPASGTMTAKYPGAGWLKTVAGTNIAAYQAGAGLGLWMQVEDNNPYADSNVGARTRQCVGWTGLDSATVLGNQINTQKYTGGWLLVADARTCYLYMGNIASASSLLSFAFGELASFYPSDAYSGFSTRGRSSAPSTVFYDNTSSSTQYGAMHFPYVRSGYDVSATNCICDILKGSSQVGGVVQAEPTYLAGRAGTTGGNTVAASSFSVGGQNIVVPNLADNSIPVSPVFCVELASTINLRGRFRGVYFPMGKMPSGFTNSHQRLDSAIIDGVSQSLLLVNTNIYNNVQVAFQIDGAWA